MRRISWPRLAWRLIRFSSVFCVVVSFAQQLTVPPGWTLHQEGSDQVAVPDAVPNGSVSVTVQAEESLDGDLASWFENRATEEIRRRGTPISRGKVERLSERALSINCTFKERGGNQSIVMYTGMLKPNGRVQFAIMKSPTDREMIQKYVRQGGLMVGNLMRAPAPTPVIDQPLPSSNTGAEIVALLHEGRGVYTMTGYQYQESVDLVLRDGTMYLDLKVPPEDFNVEASRRTEPQKWRKWRREGNDFAVLDPKTGQWSKISAVVARPLPSGSSLNRKLSASNAISMGVGGGSVFSKVIRLFPDGRFERSDSAMHGGRAGDGGYAGSVSVQNQRGRESSSSASSTTPNMGTVTARSNSRGRGNADEMAGTYRISGYTLELRTNAGTVRRLLAFYPWSNKDTDIYIQDTTYSETK